MLMAAGVREVECTGWDGVQGVELGGQSRGKSTFLIKQKQNAVLPYAPRSPLASSIAPPVPRLHASHPIHTHIFEWEIQRQAVAHPCLYLLPLLLPLLLLGGRPLAVQSNGSISLCPFLWLLGRGSLHGVKGAQHG